MTEVYYVPDPRYTATTGAEHALDNGGLREASSTQAGGAFVMFNQVPMIELDQAGLEEYYNNSPMLQNQFGSFENYNNYSTEYSGLLEQSLESGGQTWWDYESRVPTEEERITEARGNLPWLAEATDEEVLTYLSAIDASRGAASAVGSYLQNNVGPLGGIDQAAMTGGGAIIQTNNPSFAGSLFASGPAEIDPNNIGSLIGAGAGPESSMSVYNDFHSSPALQALNEQYGLTPESTRRQFVGDDGNLWQSTWNGSGFVTNKIQNIDDDFGLDDVVRIGATAFLTAGIGAGIGALAGTAGAGAGAAGGGLTAGGFGAAAGQNVLSNAIAQGVLTGNVDASSLLTAGITGGLGYIADGIQAGTLGASGNLGAQLDTAIWDLADKLGTDYQTIVDIGQGVVEGAISGGDLESIAAGAVGAYSTSEIQNYIRETFGDSMGNIEVDNWFREGTTDIPVGAFEEAVSLGVGGILGDDISASDVAGAFVDFATYDNPDVIDAEGTLAFADPNLTGLESDFDLPDLGFIEDAARVAGSAFDDEIIQPIYQNVIRPLDDAVIRPVGQALSEAETAVRRSLPNISLPEGPDINLPEGPDINLPNVNLPNIGLPQLTQGGMLGGRAGVAAPKFTPYQHQSLEFNPTIYQPPQTQKKDYVAELDNLISRGMLRA